MNATLSLTICLTTRAMQSIAGKLCIDDMTKKMPPTFMNATGQTRDFNTEHDSWGKYINEVLYKGEYPVIPVTSLQGSQLTYRSRSIVNAIYPF